MWQKWIYSKDLKKLVATMLTEERSIRPTPHELLCSQELLPPLTAPVVYPPLVVNNYTMNRQYKRVLANPASQGVLNSQGAGALEAMVREQAGGMSADRPSVQDIEQNMVTAEAFIKVLLKNLQSDAQHNPGAASTSASEQGE